MKQYLQPKTCVAVAGLLASLFPVLSPAGQEPLAQTENMVGVQSSSLLPVASPQNPDVIISTIPVVLTAYSSTIWQTDDTPFITASGKTVRDGIVAANFLPMGTRIKIPEIYGQKVFIVEDRMHPRKKFQVDIWFQDYWDALDFGAQHSTIEVLGS